MSPVDRLCTLICLVLLTGVQPLPADAANEPTADPVMLAADPQGIPLAGAPAGAPSPAFPSAAPVPVPAAPAGAPASAVPPVAVPPVPLPVPAAPQASVRPPAPKATAQPPIVRPANAGTPERRVWDRAPIPVTLAVGEERLVLMPTTMRLGIPTAVANALRTQVLGRSVYLSALRPFPRTRVLAESPETGQALLLDLSASKRAGVSRQPVEILLPSQIETQAPLGTLSAGESEPPAIDPVVLTRFAAKQIYAPKRLATALEGVRQVGVDRAPLPYLYRGARLFAQPIASWRGGDLTVTAVKLTNQGTQPVELDPREIGGSFVSAAFQHTRLSPAHTDRDTTAVYLVCQRPFGECL
jgi:integrating conjugative element protein (TIGR03749 family)